MAEVVADEHRIRHAGEDAASGVPETVELDATEPRDLAAHLIAATQRRDIQPAAPAVTDDIVLLADELDSRAAGRRPPQASGRSEASASLAFRPCDAASATAFLDAVLGGAAN